VQTVVRMEHGWRKASLLEPYLLGARPLWLKI
jgi:hypothetical protein